MSSSLVLIFVVISIIFAVLLKEYFHRKQLFQQVKRLGLPGPEPNVFLGNLGAFIKTAIKKGVEYTPFLHYDLHKKYGETFGFYFGIQNVQIYTQNLDMMKEVFIKQFSNFVDRNKSHELFNCYPMGESLLQIGKHGETNYGWKEIRSVVSPIFTTGKMKQMHPVIHERIDTFINVISEKIRSTGPVMDIYNEFQALTLDVIGRTAFGIDSNALQNRKEDFYVTSMEFFDRLSMLKSFGIFIGFVSSFLCKLYRPFSTLHKIQMKLANNLKEAVDYRKKHINEINRVDLIQLLLKEDEERQTKENKPPMHIDTIVSNCFAFLLAGYETTSTALGFTAWLLAKDQGVQQKLFEEIQREIGTKKPDYDDVMKLQYLDAVFKESLRLKPPVVLFTLRTCINDTHVCGLDIKKGEMVISTVQSIHWNENYWPDPFKFDPERFTNGAVHNPLAWVPFGIGPRNCVGMRFAELEFKTTIVELLKKFKLELCAESEQELKMKTSTIIMRPFKDVIVKVTPR